MLYISFWISPYSRYRHGKAAQWYHIWDSVGKSLTLSMLLPGRMFRIPCIPFCLLSKDFQCLRWTFLPVMPDPIFQLLYKSPCSIWSNDGFMSRLAVVIPSSGIRLRIRDCLIWFLTVTFSNYHSFFHVRVRPEKVVMIRKYLTERYTPSAGESVSS